MNGTSDVSADDAEIEVVDAPPHLTAQRLRWLAGLFVATVVFWKLRIIDAATDPRVLLGSNDIYTEHYPMSKFGFERLFAGDIPLWNPFQLTGTPFLPVTHVGLFYPANFVYAFMDTGVAIEVSFVAHLFFAGAGMWLLLRSLDFSPRAGLVAALTFMWSGWMIFYSNQASLISGMSWLPFTVWMVELALRGNRRAALGLVVAVAFQLFNGATEFFVYNMYISGAYAAVRLVGLGLAGDWPTALRRAGMLLGGVLAGVLLAAPQLLPSMQLAGESVRGAEPMTFAQARFWGAIKPTTFVLDALMTREMVTVGVLPLAGMILGAATRRRWLFLLCLALVVLSTFLVFGGQLYWLYFHTPLGDLFRRPHKFLHVYAFGQAIMAALAVLALESHLATPVGRLVRSPALILCVAGLGAAALWVHASGETPVALWCMIVGLLGFVAVPPGRGREVVLIALIGLQAVNLFFGVKQDFKRPAAQREHLHWYDVTIERLARDAGAQRVHIVPDVLMLPGLMQKVGTMRGFRVLGDYSPLSSKRAADYFARVGPPPNPKDRNKPFAGEILPTAKSDWRLLDLTSTRLYVVRPGSDAEKHLKTLARRPARTGVVLREPKHPIIYERTTALPRAYFVAGARHAGDAEAALDLLQSPDFRPRREVVLEGAPVEADPSGRVGSTPVQILADEREHVTLRVDASAPGYVVLTDAHRPGWRAELDGAPVPIYMANALFRAVRVPAGESEIVMTYRSAPFERGLVISGVTLIALLGVVWHVRRGNARS
jgi:hypothetical protein